MSIATLPRLRCDPVFPQRNTLLDTAQMAERFQARLGLPVQGEPLECKRIRTKYRFGESLRGAYRLHGSGDPLWISIRAFPGDRARREYERAMARARPCTSARAVALDAELACIYWVFPNDRKLGNLSALTEPGSSFPLRSGVGAWAWSELVAYAPEKSATVRWSDEAGRTLAYAKAYGEGHCVLPVRQLEDLGACLRTEGRQVRTNRVLAADVKQGIVISEPAPGQPMAALAQTSLGSATEALGQAIGLLHECGPRTGLRPFNRLALDNLLPAGEALARAMPSIAGLARDVAGELAACWCPHATELVCLHGDIHPKNALVADDRLTMIDLDQMALGHPAADLGSFLAWVHAGEVRGSCSPSEASTLRRAFLAGYGAIRPLPPRETLRCLTAAALLVERALRAVNRMRVAWWTAEPHLLQRARRLRRGEQALA